MTEDYKPTDKRDRRAGQRHHQAGMALQDETPPDVVAAKGFVGEDHRLLQQ